MIGIYLKDSRLLISELKQVKIWCCVNIPVSQLLFNSFIQLLRKVPEFSSFDPQNTNCQMLYVLHGYITVQATFKVQYSVQYEYKGII